MDHLWLLLASLVLLAFAWSFITSLIEFVSGTLQDMARTVANVLGLTATIAVCTVQGTYHLGRWGYNKLRH